MEGDNGRVIILDYLRSASVDDARLIEAAPDMLAALRIALHDYTLSDSAARVVENAIAKAEGGEATDINYGYA